MEKLLLVNLNDVLEHLDRELDFYKSMRQTVEAQVTNLVLGLDLCSESISESDRLKLQQHKTRIEQYEESYNRTYDLKCRLQIVLKSYPCGGGSNDDGKDN